MLSMIISVVISAALANNFVLAQTYGICPFLGVSKKTSSAVGMGAAVTVVMVVATMITYPIYMLLVALDIRFLEILVFIFVIAALLGVEMGDEEPTVACVMCSGGANAVNLYKYSGIGTCVYEAQLFKGAKMCDDGCLGFGTCLKACPEHAITVHDSVAYVDPDVCISCGVCMNACPKNLIERIPASAPVYVACSSHCKGKEVMNMCKSGCISCGLCVKNCPEQAITMKDNIPRIDYSKCTGCFTCVSKCPRKVIKVRAERLEKPAAKAE